ncbi:MAG: lytic transglycosylase domain-containing protein [Endozoicomonadaceae bacterium]|nr:lytic transglycosylase domain-containing protein [Endozoicomonadaceae bacterium]
MNNGRCHPKKISGTKSLLTLLLLSVCCLTSNKGHTEEPVRDLMYKHQWLKPYKKLKTCIKSSATKFKLDEMLLLAVIAQERGSIGTRIKASDGTYDHNVMQINSVRKNELERLGYNWKRIKNEGCYHIYAATHLLSIEIREAGSVWKGVGRYHYDERGAKPIHHYKYRNLVAKKLRSLIAFYNNNIITY